MTRSSSGFWRLSFVLSAAFVLTGGPRHPFGTMAEMLAHPNWTPSHLLLLVGFVSLLIGLVLYHRGSPLSNRTRTWVRSP